MHCLCCDDADFSSWNFLVRAGLASVISRDHVLGVILKAAMKYSVTEYAHELRRDGKNIRIDISTLLNLLKLLNDGWSHECAFASSLSPACSGLPTGWGP
jgi:hypothetical protein